MPKRIVIVPYKMGSTSAKALKDALVEEGIKCMRVAPNSRTYKPKKDDFLIYYGGVDIIRGTFKDVMNVDRHLATNKLRSLQAIQEAGISTVPFVTQKEDIPNDWKQIVARATLTGHSGQGITIHSTKDECPVVPLYTKYIKKTYECRVHVMNGEVIDAQVKRKTANATTEHNPLIRNIHTGWVYCRDNFTLDEKGAQIALAAVTSLGLQFGAVDLIYNQHYNEFYVLEVNTAPGLTGTTLSNYVKGIKKWFQ